MKKIIITIIIVIILIILILGLIYINYKSDVEAINNLNVNLNDVDINDIKFSSFKLNFNIEINNPSDRNIVDLSTDFEIYIENNYVGEGDFSNVNIPYNSNINKDVIVTVYYDGLADAAVDIIKNIIDEGEFNLKIEGTIYAKALFGISIIEQNYFATKTYK
jgi:LEA14-like dessication related protein